MQQIILHDKAYKITHSVLLKVDIQNKKTEYCHNINQHVDQEDKIAVNSWFTVWIIVHIGKFLPYVQGLLINKSLPYMYIYIYFLWLPTYLGTKHKNYTHLLHYAIQLRCKNSKFIPCICTILASPPSTPSDSCPSHHPSPTYCYR